MRTLWIIVLGLPLALTGCEKRPAQPAEETKPDGPAKTNKEKSVEEWIVDLQDRNPEARRKAIQALGKMGPKAETAAPEVAKTLKDDSPTTRKLAAEALGKIGPGAKSTIPALIVAVTTDKEPVVCQQAIVALGLIDPTADGVLPVLGKALSGKDVGVAQRAGDVLSGLGKAAVPTLIAELKSADPNNPEVRSHVLKALAKTGLHAEEAVPALIEVLATETRHRSVRQQAAEALGEVGPGAKKAVPTLITVAASDKEAAVRRQAVQALSRIDPNDKDVLAALGKAFKDRDRTVQQEATERLKEIRKGAVPTLVILSRDQDAAVAGRAVSALGDIGKEAREAQKDLALALRSKDRAVRQKAIDALGRIGPKEETVVPSLIGALSDGSADVRQFAFDNLGSLGQQAKAALKPLLDLAVNREADLRSQAIKALGRIDAKDDRVLGLLSKAWKDESMEVRHEALTALRACGEDALPILIEALKDVRNDVLVPACDALGRLGPKAKRAVSGLKGLAGESDKQVSSAAIEALKKIDPEAAKDILP